MRCADVQGRRQLTGLGRQKAGPDSVNIVALPQRCYLWWRNSPGWCTAQMCRIEGKSYMAGLPQKAGLESLNNVAVPSRHIGVPAEDGAFDFVPNQYTRKQ